MRRVITLAVLLSLFLVVIMEQSRPCTATIEVRLDFINEEDLPEGWTGLEDDDLDEDEGLSEPSDLEEDDDDDDAIDSKDPLWGPHDDDEDSEEEEEDWIDPDEWIWETGGYEEDDEYEDDDDDDQYDDSDDEECSDCEIDDDGLSDEEEVEEEVVERRLGEGEQATEDTGPFFIPSHMLLNGRQVPRLGFGTAGLGEATFDAVTHALAHGFRLIDTAAATMWYDEVEVGKAIASMAEEIPREDIILVTKIWPVDFGQKKTLEAAERSLTRLGTDYVDLLLLHFPECVNCDPDPERGTWLDAWRALEELFEQGKAKAIGVSNFDAPLLESLLEVAHIPPHDVQNWMDPLHQDRVVRGLCDSRGIHYTSYSTLGTQWLFKNHEDHNPVLENPLVKQLAERHHVTPVQIVLSWALQENVSVIPRSSRREHIDELAEFFEGTDMLRAFLTQSELDEIDELDHFGPELFELYAKEERERRARAREKEEDEQFIRDEL